MPRKIDTPIIVARYGDKVAGWAGDDKGGRLSGDTEWVQAAKDASAVGLEFTLYNGIPLKADITDPNNPAGAFAALAWYAKERILVKTAPEGMMESLGLLDAPEEVDLFEGYEGEITEEDREFAATHVNMIIDGQDTWVPLAQLKALAPPSEFLANFLKDFSQEEESASEEENPEEITSEPDEEVSDPEVTTEEKIHEPAE